MVEARENSGEPAVGGIDSLRLDAVAENAVGRRVQRPLERGAIAAAQRIVAVLREKMERIRAGAEDRLRARAFRVVARVGEIVRVVAEREGKVGQESARRFPRAFLDLI